MHHAKKQTGFTLVELLLAMSFIAVLLLAIATITLLVSQVYNKGMATKEINQLSRVISDDLVRDIAASPSFSVVPADNQYINTNWSGDKTGSPTGRICTGKFSYVWNYGWALSSGNTGVTKYSAGKTDKIRLVRIPDASYKLCTKVSGKLPAVDPTTAVELLSDNDHDLMIHQMLFQQASTGGVDTLTGQQLYYITFTLGTSDQKALARTNTTADTGPVTGCKATSVAGADLAFCVVQQFSLVARAQHGVN